MGWCRGTEVFDTVYKSLYEDGCDSETVLHRLIDVLEGFDWDCQPESGYWDEPLVRKIFKERHPHWFDGEE